MGALKNEASDDILSSPSQIPITRELKSRQTSVFPFDMDREQLPNSRNPQRARSTSTPTTTGQQQQHLDVNVQGAALLAQFAAAAETGDLDHVYASMLAQNSYPPMDPASRFYGNFLHHDVMAPPQLPPLSSLDFPWPNLPPHTTQPGPSNYDPPHTTQPGPSNYDPHHTRQRSSNYDPHQATSSTSPPHFPHVDTHYGSLPLDTSRGNRLQEHSNSPTLTRDRHTTSSPEVDQTETDHFAIADEKRRRNTAASARFRVKKKHKTISLERSVSDLTGRAEELEREAADLRRENGWLKEIVILKGSRFAAANSQARIQALSQAAALAPGGQLTSAETGGPSGSGSASALPEEFEQRSLESESSDEEDKKSRKKGKGKQKETRKK